MMLPHESDGREREPWRQAGGNGGVTVFSRPGQVAGEWGEGQMEREWRWEPACGPAVGTRGCVCRGK